MAKKKKAARESLKRNARPGVRRALAGKAKKAKAAKWTSNRGAERAASAKTSTRSEKQPALIQGLRIKSLDNVCGHISDTRAAIARLQGEEADLERQAHDLLKKHDKTSWQHAGVVLVRVPGEEKLVVKTVRSRGPAPEAQPETDGPTQTEERTGAVEGEPAAPTVDPNAPDVDEDTVTH